MTTDPQNTVHIAVQPDTLDSENARFTQVPLAQPVFLNSLPKSGSHLLRNIIRMFVPVPQQYKAQFIQWANLDEHRHAFDADRRLLSWGHLFFSDRSALLTSGTKRLLLVRDPYDWVLARARFFVSAEVSSANLDQLKSGRLSTEALLNLMIFGIHGRAPGIYDIFVNNGVAWLGTGVHVVHYEDLRTALKAIDTPDGEAYFADLLGACGIDMPADWRERVRIGADPAQSGTARENLTGVGIDLPDSLPEIQRRLVEIAIPGVRALLGYA